MKKLPAKVVLVDAAAVRRRRRRVRRKKAKRRDADCCCPPRDSAGFAVWMLRQRELKILRDRFYPTYSEDWLGQGFDIGCKVLNSGTRTVAAGATVTLLFPSEDWDTTNIHAGTGGGFVFTEAGAGKYLVCYEVAVKASFVGQTDVVQTVSALCRINGSLVNGSASACNLFRATYRTGDDLGQVVHDNIDGVLVCSFMANVAAGDLLNMLGSSGNASLGSSVSIDYTGAVISLQKLNVAGRTNV